MANTAEEIAYNAKVVELSALWDALVDARTAGQDILLVPCTHSKGAESTAMETTTMQTTSANQKMRLKFHIGPATSATNAEYLIKDPAAAEMLGGMPMFWYVTNAAGEMDTS